MLKEMKVAELREVATAFGIDHSESKTKTALLAQLAEEGVTDDEYSRIKALENDNASDEAEEKEQPKSIPVPKNSSEEVVVYMNRANPTFEILGFRFTKDHPYAVMPVETAQDLFEYDPRGFRLANQEEVKRYYS